MDAREKPLAGGAKWYLCIVVKEVFDSSREQWSRLYQFKQHSCTISHPFSAECD